MFITLNYILTVLLVTKYPDNLDHMVSQSHLLTGESRSFSHSYLDPHMLSLAYSNSAV